MSFVPMSYKQGGMLKMWDNGWVLGTMPYMQGSQGICTNHGLALRSGDGPSGYSYCLVVAVVCAAYSSLADKADRRIRRRLYHWIHLLAHIRFSL